MASYATRGAHAQHADENGAAAAAKGKVGGGAGAAARRQPFGEISNIVNQLTERCNVSGKDGGVGGAPAAAKDGGAGGGGAGGLFAHLTGRAHRAANTSSMTRDLVDKHDIDYADRENPLACTDYVNDIYSYFRRVEPTYCVPPNYMAQQADINDRMRAILVDWLIEVHLKFKLMPETLYLTVNLIDRFLAKKQVSRRNLQLVGVTAMLIASKYEEIWAPEVRDFVYISDKAYTRDQILGMERQMLATLNFNLTVPTTFVFLRRFGKAAGADKTTEMLTNYLVELAMPDAGMLKYQPSLLAATATYLALKTMKSRDAWSSTLQRHAQYNETVLLPPARELLALHKKAGTQSLVAVHKKYSSSKFLQVAQIGPLEAL